MLEYGEVVTSGQNLICPPPEVVIAKFGSRWSQRHSQPSRGQFLRVHFGRPAAAKLRL